MKKTETKKALIVTDKQLQVIKDACELYGRIQIGQFNSFAEIVTQTGFSGFGMRCTPEAKDGETREHYEARCRAQHDRDDVVCDCLKGAIEGIYREAYRWEGKPRTNESSIALDIWAVLDGRRKGGFHMGSEPLPEVNEVRGEK